MTSDGCPLLSKCDVDDVRWILLPLRLVTSFDVRCMWASRRIMSLMTSGGFCSQYFWCRRMTSDGCLSVLTLVHDVSLFSFPLSFVFV